jgi:DNA-binding IclR family transcriptional regulator
MSKNAPDGNTELGTTTTSLEVLEALERFDGARLADLAAELEMPASTLHGHVATLRSKQFLVQEGNLYFPGPKLLRLGEYVRSRREGYEIAERYVGRLFEETGFRTVFVAEQGGRGVFLYTKSGDQSDWAHERIGKQIYLHNTAVGKAILAEMSSERVNEIVDRWGLPGATKNTIQDIDALEEELERIRDRGYATNEAENIESLHAIGAAATGPDDFVIGAFSLSGPRMVLPGVGTAALENTLLQHVEEYELELNLG